VRNLFFILPASLFWACTDKEETDTGIEGNTDIAIDLMINGDYEDNYGWLHSISNTNWTSGDSVFFISQFNNEEMYAVALNDSANEWNADLWSKFQWTWDEEELFYCQSAFDAASEDAAVVSIIADSNDLSSGCGGFAWSGLREPFVLTGQYEDNYNSTHTINAFLWETVGSLFHITKYDNTAGWAVAQNASANEWNADLWSKFEWSWDNDVLYYCQSTYDAATAEDAMAATADNSNFETGCGSFAWSTLTVQ
jgi:hypothetical protein